MAYGPKPKVFTEPKQIERQKKNRRRRSLHGELGQKEKELHIAKMLIAALREENEQLRAIDTAKETDRWEDLLSRLKTLTEDVDRYLTNSVRNLKRIRQRKLEYKEKPDGQS